VYNATLHLTIITWVSSHMQLKQFLYRYEKALSAPGGRGSQISRQLAHEGGKVVTPKHRPLLPQEISLVLLLTNYSTPRAIVWPKGLCKWKIPIEPATFRLVAHCPNHLRHHVPRTAKHNSLIQHHRQMCTFLIQEARYKTHSYCILHSHNIRHPDDNSPNCRHDWAN